MFFFLTMVTTLIICLFSHFEQSKYYELRKHKLLVELSKLKYFIFFNKLSIKQ